MTNVWPGLISVLSTLWVVVSSRLELGLSATQECAQRVVRRQGPARSQPDSISVRELDGRVFATTVPAVAAMVLSTDQLDGGHSPRTGPASSRARALPRCRSAFRYFVPDCGARAAMARPKAVRLSRSSASAPFRARSS